MEPSGGSGGGDRSSWSYFLFLADGFDGGGGGVGVAEVDITAVWYLTNPTTETREKMREREGYSLRIIILIPDALRRKRSGAEAQTRLIRPALSADGCLAG